MTRTRKKPFLKKNQLRSKTGQYSYHRTSDGCHDVFFIDDRDGTTLLGLYFWEEPDTDEADEAERRAKKLVAALNMPGGWIDQDVAIHSTLRQYKELAVMWYIRDVQDIRPDLTDDQAWQVLRRVDDQHDKDRGITCGTVARAAVDLFGPGPETAKTGEE